ncbi:2168_t:CDS:2, partial [Acaulospora colombiana]
MKIEINAEQDGDSDHDLEMVSARSQISTTVVDVGEQQPSHLDKESSSTDLDTRTFENPIGDNHQVVVEEPAAAPSLDLLDRIPGMYRLLDLVNEEGSGGIGKSHYLFMALILIGIIVDKVIIDQKSVAAFANCLHPGSYRSEFQVDFHALDNHTIKPLGIYGSMSALVKFLERLGKLDQET